MFARYAAGDRQGAPPCRTVVRFRASAPWPDAGPRHGASAGGNDDRRDTVRRSRPLCRRALRLTIGACDEFRAIRVTSRNAQSGADMKVNVEIDCTPLEARQFLGLPDMQPMQTAVMDKLQQQMMANIEKVSPEALMQSWFTFDPKLAERFSDMFVSMAGLARDWRHRHQGQEVVTAMDDERQRAGAASPAQPRPAAGRGEGDIRIQRQPVAVAAVDARAARRRSSGAGVAGISRQRSVDGADAPISQELGYDAYAWKMGRNTGGVARMRAILRDRLADIHAAPAARSASSDGASAASMRAIWRCRRRTWCAMS